MGKKIIVAGLFSVICSPAFAQDWKPLNAEGIVAALTERTLVYEDGARQMFRESGRTSYSVGAGDSQGSWRVKVINIARIGHLPRLGAAMPLNGMLKAVGCGLLRPAAMLPWELM
jgi:hypothetical protein